MSTPRGDSTGLARDTAAPACYASTKAAVISAPYRTYAQYLNGRYGCSVYRVAVDAGFSCPNRNGQRTARGCTYCAADGARAPYLSRGTSDNECASFSGLAFQVEETISFLRRRYSAEAFILFFQAYSNTHAPVETLRRVYDEGLALAPFKGLNVATRPDCVDEAKADLLASYMDRGLEVWAELGLQSANDATLRRVRRGHTMDDFRNACRLLQARSVKVGVHLIFGLPGEGLDDITDTIDAVARLRPDGVKIHNLHVPAGTALAGEYLRGEITVPGPERHLDYVVAAIERLPGDTVIMRLTCDTPKKALVAPRGFWDKHRFTAKVAEEMRARGTWQGRLMARGADQA